MKNRAFIIPAFLALAVLVAAPFAFAKNGRHGRGGDDFGGDRVFRHLQHAKETLGLSDDQVTQIRGIFADMRKQNAPYRESLRGGRQSIVQTLLNNPNDLAAAQALIDQQTAAERALKTNVLNATSKALNVLNAGQRAKLSTLVETRMARRALR